MKTLHVLVAAALLFMPTQDKVKIEPKFTANQKTKYKISMNFKVSSGEATVSSDVASNVTAADEKGATVEYTWTDTKVAFNGQDLTPNNNPYVAKFDATGALVEVTGGMEGTDAVRTFLLLYPHLPKDELAKDGTWKATLPKDAKLELAERTIEGTYLGPEDVAGKKTLKLKIKVAETGTTFKTNLTCWVTADGQMVKVDGDFSGLQIPAVNEESEGHVKAELVP